MRTSELASRSFAMRTGPRWLVAAIAVALLSSMLPATANAQSDECALGYTPDANVYFGHDAETDVPNYEADDGCTIMDRIMAAAPFRNHGAFVSTVARETRELQRDGVLSAKERSDIVSTAGGSAVGKPVATDRNRPVPVDNIGVVSFTVRNQMSQDPAGTLQALEACGIENLEPSGGVGNYHGLTAAEMADLADDLGISTPTVGVRSLLNNAEGAIEDATTLGASYVRDSGPSSWDLDDYVDAAARLNEVGAQLADAGLKIAYHNHGHEFDEVADGVTGYDVLVRGTDPNLVTFELDTYWAESVGVSTVDLFEEYPGRFELLHLKDMAFDDNGNPTFADVGEGVIDFPEIFAHAEIGNVQWSYIEHDQPSPDGITSACNSMANLASMTY